VPSDHWSNRSPGGIAEVRRILTKYAGGTAAPACAGSREAQRYNGETPAIPPPDEFLYRHLAWTFAAPCPHRTDPGRDLHWHRRGSWALVGDGLGFMKRASASSWTFIGIDLVVSNMRRRPSCPRSMMLRFRNKNRERFQRWRRQLPC